MTGGQHGTPAATASNHDIPRLAVLHHGLMVHIRAFERTAETGQDRGLVLYGAMHLSIGQEAVAAGICAQLRRDDLLLSTYRGHGHIQGHRCPHHDAWSGWARLAALPTAAAG